MDATLESIAHELDTLAERVIEAVGHDRPLGINHGNWSFPCVTRSELAEMASSLASVIRSRGKDHINPSNTEIMGYPERITFTRDNVLQQFNGNPHSVPTYCATLEFVKRGIEAELFPEQDMTKALHRAALRVKALEARLANVEPRTASLDTMVLAIERAHETADQLPADLASLQEARNSVSELAIAAEDDRNKSLIARTSAEEAAARLKENAKASYENLESSSEGAAKIVARIEAAYSAATSYGLAAAFSQRSDRLSRSMWVWVGGLIAALLAGAYFGSRQLHTLLELLATPGIAAGAVSLNIGLSILSISAPIWFGWLATKQIGQRFRLAEDYAFKASVSQAYEGYRREAARVDPTFAARLLESALTRLDEQPLRLVESASYGSPWHELAGSEVIRDAVKSLPGFPAAVADFAKDMLQRARRPQAAASTRVEGSPPEGPPAA